MSAAETAHTGPDRHGPLATVLALPPTDSPRRRPPSSRERTHVPIQPDGSTSEEQRLVAWMEAEFAEAGRSLTDESTAQDYLITLTQMRKLLRGALEQDLISEKAHAALDGMVQGMMRAPALLG